MTFQETLHAVAGRRRISLPSPTHPEPLAHLDYAVELALKREALAAFWREARLPGVPEPVVGAPRPRGYRTTSKRRAWWGSKGLRLEFPGLQTRERRLTPSGHPVRTARGSTVFDNRPMPSLLDLPEHGPVYTYLVDQLRQGYGRNVAAVLNWVVVRGDAGALALILNVKDCDARVVRAARQFAESVTAASLGVASCFLYLDPSRSEYYLEAKRPESGLSFKRLAGPGQLEVRANGVRLRFPPTAFSQVNAAMLETMIESARTLLAPDDSTSLLDLYCGYGLFTFTLGGQATHVVGVDHDGPAIEAARTNAEHLKQTHRTRFLSGRIDGEFLESRLRAPRGPEVVLLDPPRQGTALEVAEALAAREPLRVVQICCGTDEIPREVAAWKSAGYRLDRAVPLDFFAGTIGLETLLLLVPNQV